MAHFVENLNVEALSVPKYTRQTNETMAVKTVWNLIANEYIEYAKNTNKFMYKNINLNERSQSICYVPRKGTIVQIGECSRSFSPIDILIRNVF